MLILIAFLGGILSILSPCTLPIVPLLFAGSRGKASHIMALLSGMVIMFVLLSTLITFTSEWLINATEVGRILALLLFTVAGVALIFPAFAELLSRPIVKLGGAFNKQSMNTSGVISHLFAGLGVGLLWAPCAGPILGIIFGLNLSGTSPYPVALLLTAYAIGSALIFATLLIFGKTIGRAFISKIGAIERFRQFAGVAVLGSVLLISTGAETLLPGSSDIVNKLEEKLLSTTSPAASQQPKLVPIALAEPSSKMPSLEGGTGWVNGEPISQESLKGKVVLIQFWTFGCINCKRTLPYIRDWANKYKDQGLVVIGIHTPEFSWEKNPKSVQEAIEKWKLPYPSITDNDFTIWKAFGNHYWPAQYFFDGKGQLRYMHIGENAYQEQEQVIQKLLDETKS